MWSFLIVSQKQPDRCPEGVFLFDWFIRSVSETWSSILFLQVLQLVVVFIRIMTNNNRIPNSIKKLFFSPLFQVQFQLSLVFNFVPFTVVHCLGVVHSQTLPNIEQWFNVNGLTCSLCSASVTPWPPVSEIIFSKSSVETRARLPLAAPSMSSRQPAASAVQAEKKKTHNDETVYNTFITPL